MRNSGRVGFPRQPPCSSLLLLAGVPNRLPAPACPQSHRFSYNEPMPAESCTQSLCDLALRFGEDGEDSMSRPFGVALLVAGWDQAGPVLYHTDPSGPQTTGSGR